MLAIAVAHIPQVLHDTPDREQPTQKPPEYTAGLPDIPRYKLNGLFSCQLV